MKHSDYSIYFDDGNILTITAANLRKALTEAEKQKGGAEIVAALASECLPPPSPRDLPFHAVLLRNPNFDAQE